MTPDPDASRPAESLPSPPTAFALPWRRPYESMPPGDDARGARAMLVSTAVGAELGRQLGSLEALGCESVSVVREPRHAVAMAGSLGPRLVMIDLHGADVDVLLDAARALRRWPGLALVIALGELDDRRLDCARALDPHGVLARPCRPGALEQAVAIAFARLRSETARRTSEPGGLDEAWRTSVAAVHRDHTPFCVGILQARRADGQKRSKVDDGRLASAIRLRLREALGLTGGIVRVGPQAFAFITDIAGPLGIARPGRELVAAFATPVDVGERAVPLRVGVGMAPWCGDDDDLESLLHAADSVIPSTRRAMAGRWRAVSPRRDLARLHEPLAGMSDGPLPAPLGVALGWGAFALALWVLATRGNNAPGDGVSA